MSAMRCRMHVQDERSIAETRDSSKSEQFGKVRKDSPAARSSHVTRHVTTPSKRHISAYLNEHARIVTPNRVEVIDGTLNS